MQAMSEVSQSVFERARFILSCLAQSFLLELTNPWLLVRKHMHSGVVNEHKGCGLMGAASWHVAWVLLTANTHICWHLFDPAVDVDKEAAVLNRKKEGLKMC